VERAAVTIEIGLHFPHFGPLATAMHQADVLALAEDVGIHTIWVGDHVVVPTDVASRYPYHESGSASFDAEVAYHEPFSVLAWAAGRTQRVRLGFSVLVVPYRHPLLTAKIAATIDDLSGGRLTLGVGVGWMAEEFAALGADFARRGEVTDEYLDVMTTAWAASPATYEGSHVAFPPVGVLPLPVQRPRPPLLVGGHSRPAMRRALRAGDGWQATANTPEELRDLLEQLTDLAGGRLPEGFSISSRMHLPRFSTDGTDGISPEEIRALVAAYRDAGAQHLVVHLWDRDPDRYLARLEVLAGWLGLDQNGRATAI
jgi:probable F420-dependent oxidoreductase